MRAREYVWCEGGRGKGGEARRLHFLLRLCVVVTSSIPARPAVLLAEAVALAVREYRDVVLFFDVIGKAHPLFVTLRGAGPPMERQHERSRAVQVIGSRQMEQISAIQAVNLDFHVQRIVGVARV